MQCPSLWCRRIQIRIPKNQICTVLLQSFRSSLSDYGRQCFDPERLLVWKSDFDLLQKVSWKWKVNFEFRKKLCCAANPTWCGGLEYMSILHQNVTIFQYLAKNIYSNRNQPKIQISDIQKMAIFLVVNCTYPHEVRIEHVVCVIL